MEVNLANEAENKMNEVRDIIDKKFPAWIQEDCFYWSIPKPKRGGLSLSIKNLWYEQKGYMWVMVTVSLFDIEDKDFVDYIRKSIGLKAFHDEDSRYGYYTDHKNDKNHEGYFKLSFYVNPEQPDGAWQNHALPYR